MEQIIVLIDPETAAVKIEVKGVSGSGCAKLTEALEKALGETTEDTKTHAYHEPAEARFTLTIAPDGTIQFLWDDALAPLLQLGESAIRRASYVEPEGTEWTADLHPAGGPVLGPFPLRCDALTAERDWLLKHLSLDPLP